jgi:hypothetical protein
VWPAVGIDLRQPFSSPCRGVMGSGRKPQNGRQGPGPKHRGALFFLVTDHFGSTRPIRADSRYLVAFAVSLMIYPLCIARRLSGTIGVKRAAAAESASGRPMSLCKDSGTMPTINEVSTDIASLRLPPKYLLWKRVLSFGVGCTRQGNYRPESRNRDLAIINNCRNSEVLVLFTGCPKDWVSTGGWV